MIYKYKIISLIFLLVTVGTTIADYRSDHFSSSYVSGYVERDLPTPGDALTVAWSPDSTILIASSSFGRFINVWDRAGNLLHRIEQEGGGLHLFKDIAFVKGSSEFIFPPPGNATRGAYFDIWDIKTGRMIQEVMGPWPQTHPLAHADYIEASPDQKVVAAASLGAPIVSIYNTNTWKILRNIQTGVVSCLSFFPNSRYIAVGLVGGRVSVFDIYSGQMLETFPQKSSVYGNYGIDSIAVSPGEDDLAEGTGIVLINGPYANSPSEVNSWINSIHSVRDIHLVDGKELAYLAIPDTPIRGVVWDPRGRYAAFIDDNTSLYFWRPQNRGDRPLIVHVPSASSLAISADASKLAVARHEGVRIFSIQ